MFLRQDEDEEGEQGEKAAAAEEKEPPQETRIEVDVPKISTDLGKVRVGPVDRADGVSQG